MNKTMPKSQLTVPDLIEKAARTKELTTSTLRMHRCTISPFFTHTTPMAVDKVTRETAEDWKEWALTEGGPKGEGYTKSTVKTRLGYLHGAWAEGIRKGWIENKVNPWDDLIPKKWNWTKKHYPSYAYSHFEGIHSNPLFQAWWMYGGRSMEMAGIQPEEVFWDAEVPYIMMQHNKVRLLKNEWGVRKLPIIEPFKRYLKKFPFSKNPRSGGNFSRLLVSHYNVSAHGIRDHFHTRMRKAEINSDTQRYIVGHSLRTDVHLQYGDFDLETVKEALEKIHKITTT